jgi:phytoene dehydrogenase-like protein
LGAGRPAPETAIANLHCVGHWTRPGGGVTPVIVSAQQVARTILRGAPDRAPLGLPAGLAVAGVS